MKRLRNPTTGEIRRVPDHQAKHLASYGWTYVSKGEWKRHVRPKPAAMRAGAAKAVDILIAGKANLRRLG